MKQTKSNAKTHLHTLYSRTINLPQNHLILNYPNIKRIKTILIKTQG